MSRPAPPGRRAARRRLAARPLCRGPARPGRGRSNWTSPRLVTRSKSANGPASAPCSPTTRAGRWPGAGAPGRSRASAASRSTACPTPRAGRHWASTSDCRRPGHSAPGGVPAAAGRGRRPGAGRRRTDAGVTGRSGAVERGGLAHARPAGRPRRLTDRPVPGSARPGGPALARRAAAPPPTATGASGATRSTSAGRNRRRNWANSTRGWQPYRWATLPPPADGVDPQATPPVCPGVAGSAGRPWPGEGTSRSAGGHGRGRRPGAAAADAGTLGVPHRDRTGRRGGTECVPDALGTPLIDASLVVGRGVLGRAPPAARRGGAVHSPVARGAGGGAAWRLKLIPVTP